MSESVPSFSAPWNRTLRIVTLVVALVCLAITASLWPIIQAQGPGSMHFWGGLLPTLLVVACAACAVKGYRLEGDELVVERLLWANRFSLQKLQSVRPEPQLMRQSNSVLGNSGFFGFMGLFKQPQIGVFRALVTDPDRLLLLDFSERRLAISPADEARFVASVKERNPAVEHLAATLVTPSKR